MLVFAVACLSQLKLPPKSVGMWACQGVQDGLPGECNLGSHIPSVPCKMCTQWVGKQCYSRFCQQKEMQLIYQEAKAKKLSRGNGNVCPSTDLWRYMIYGNTHLFTLIPTNRPEKISPWSVVAKGSTEVKSLGRKKQKQVQKEHIKLKLRWRDRK